MRNLVHELSKLATPDSPAPKHVYNESVVGEIVIPPYAISIGEARGAGADYGAHYDARSIY